VAEFDYFLQYLNWAESHATAEAAGMNAILKKFDIATKWYTDSWGLYLFQIRREVRKRQEAINEYTRNNVIIYDLK
jgi:uncharacterized protein YqeY